MAFSNLLSGRDPKPMAKREFRDYYPKAKCRACGNTWGILIPNEPYDASGPSSVRLHQPPTYVNASGMIVRDENGTVIDRHFEPAEAIANDWACTFENAEVRCSWETAARWEGIPRRGGDLQAVECLYKYCNHRVVLDPEELASRDFSAGEI